MQTLLALAVSTGFTFYPAFGDHGTPPDPRLEAIVDKGVIYELIVNCSDGTAILSYSKIERLFCTPYSGCTTEGSAAISRACHPLK